MILVIVVVIKVRQTSLYLHLVALFYCKLWNVEMKRSRPGLKKYICCIRTKSLTTLNCLFEEGIIKPYCSSCDSDTMKYIVCVQWVTKDSGGMICSLETRQMFIYNYNLCVTKLFWKCQFPNLLGRHCSFLVTTMYWWVNVIVPWYWNWVSGSGFPYSLLLPFSLF